MFGEGEPQVCGLCVGVGVWATSCCVCVGLSPCVHECVCMSVSVCASVCLLGHAAMQANQHKAEAGWRYANEQNRSCQHAGPEGESLSNAAKNETWIN